MSFTQNRFGALLGEEETEIDKLGNIKPVEKKGDAPPPTRREQRRATTGTRQPAGKLYALSDLHENRVAPPIVCLQWCLTLHVCILVSPPSRRDRGNRKDVSESTQVSSTETSSRPARPERAGRNEHSGRGRQFDRHSGTGIQ